MKKTIIKAERREKVHARIRRTVSGSAVRPRIAVFKSNKYIYAQMIDDAAGRTLASASSLEAELRGQVKGTGSIAAAKLVGEALAKRAKEKGLTNAVFDRGGWRYHGRIKALAEGARSGGLQF